MRTLVTGGAGFIGSNLVDALVADGHTVSVADNLTTGRRSNLNPNARLYEVDVREADGIETLFAAERPEIVFHLAAQIDVRRSVSSPGFDAAVNVAGTAVVLEAARAHGARRFMLACTGGALYGEAELVPTPETARLAPLSPYGASKAAAESYCDLYARLHGLSTVSLRLANVYGPRQDPRGEAGVVALFCAAALEARPATVFGDGRQTRDYVYVGDVVAAFRRAATSSLVGAVNVGTGQQTTVLDLLDLLGLDGEHEPERLGEVRRSCLDPALAAARLPWRATTSLPEGLRRTGAWAEGLEHDREARARGV